MNICSINEHSLLEICPTHRRTPEVMNDPHDDVKNEEKTRKRRRQSQHDTIKYLNEYRPQFLFGLTQTIKMVRHDDDSQVTVAQYYRARGLFPLEASSSEICMPNYSGQSPLYTTYNPRRKTTPPVKSQSSRQHMKVLWCVVTSQTRSTRSTRYSFSSKLPSMPAAADDVPRLLDVPMLPVRCPSDITSCQLQLCSTQAQPKISPIGRLLAVLAHMTLSSLPLFCVDFTTRVLIMRSGVVSLLFLTAASAHLATWNPGTYDCGYPDPNSDRPVWPLWQTDKWWWHSSLDCPSNGTQPIPSNSSLKLEFASNKAFTSMGQGLMPDPEQVPDPWQNVNQWGNMHADKYPEDIMGCALAIAYKSDRYSVTPQDFIVFSVVHDCPVRQLQTFQIPPMPPCPPGGCECTWLWINKAHQSYMNPFKCHVTNGDPHLDVPVPTVPTDCTGGTRPCVDSAKTPLFYGVPTQSFAALVPIRDTIFQLSPRYNSTWGFHDGAQDVFPRSAVTTSSTTTSSSSSSTSDEMTKTSTSDEMTKTSSEMTSEGTKTTGAVSKTDVILTQPSNSGQMMHPLLFLMMSLMIILVK
ncbi:hypothetical protein PROFUN_05667 [Planoprotostelium fungivorum]|uniref:Uncharacterized protein n=1 Tax=Planoprotostelium fungivorum TaxID=1890364 RepID=A0A2P6MUM9_9EUKA|nr:hypothetical protein PROFUN_05667 [Planoprotostelium fungivorum]